MLYYGFYIYLPYFSSASGIFAQLLFNITGKMICIKANSHQPITKFHVAAEWRFTVKCELADAVVRFFCSLPQTYNVSTIRAHSHIYVQKHMYFYIWIVPRTSRRLTCSIRIRDRHISQNRTVNFFASK